MAIMTFLQKLYHSKPFLAIRAEINGKIDNKLNEFIAPVNHRIDSLEYTTRQSIEDAHQQTELKLRQELTQLDFRHLEEIRLLHESLLQEKQILTNQAYTFHHYFHAYIYPQFSAALSRILGDEYQHLNQYSILILLEILKNYMPHGGIWKFHGEVQGFDESKALPEKRPLSQPEMETSNNAPCRRLKILIVSGMFPSIEHGGGLRLFDIISHLAGSHDIDLFSVFDEKIDQYSLARLQGRLAAVKLVGQDGMNESTVTAWLTELGRKPGHYDVVQCEYLHSIPLLGPLRPYGGKIGFTFMECLAKSYLIKINNLIASQEFEQLEDFCQLFWTYAVAERTALNEADFCIAVTQEDSTMLQRMGGALPHIIPTCLSPSEIIDKVEQHKEITSQAGTVVFLGYFGHFPNIDSGRWYLENIHPRVKEAVPDYRFLVVGAGDTTPLQELSLGDATVEYSGRVDDITPYILKAQVCVLPLISGAGIRGKLNQYSIAGRPSVTTTIGNLGLNYEDGSEVLVADRPEAFAEAVIKLLTDQQLNRSIAEKARLKAENNFTWPVHLARLLQIYQAELPSSRRP